MWEGATPYETQRTDPTAGLVSMGEAVMDHKHAAHSARDFLAGRIAATVDKIEGGGRVDNAEAARVVHETGDACVRKLQWFHRIGGPF